MEMLCLSTQSSQLKRWQQAFPNGQITDKITDLIQLASPDTLIWLHLDCFTTENLTHICQQLLTTSPTTKLVALSSNPDPGQALNCLKMGITGCCHSMATLSYLQQVGYVVSNGGYWLGEDLIQRLIGTLDQQGPLKPTQKNENLLEKLSRREHAVALQVCKGAANKEIAQALYISERTVKAHLGSIFQKLKIRDRLQLVLLLKK